jgi:hypothetical protein
MGINAETARSDLTGEIDAAAFIFSAYLHRQFLGQAAQRTRRVDRRFRKHRTANEHKATLATADPVLLMRGQ